jgi:predicted regulator of amino acid metabolism with ACT domain
MIERHRISKEIQPQDEKEMIETEFGIEIEVEAPDPVIVKMLGVNRPEVQETWDQIESEKNVNQVHRAQLVRRLVQIHPLPHRPIL